jgi:hypothetical protein
MSSFYDDASLVVIPSGYKTSKIYAEKPTDGSGDLTFTRASGATRVGANGLIEEVRTNLCLQSNTFSNAAWNKIAQGTGTTPVVTANYTTDPFGGNNGWRLQCNLGGGTTTSDRSWLQQDIAGTTVPTTVSVYAKLNSAGSATFALTNASTDNVTITSTDWVRISTVRTIATTVYSFRIGLIGGFGQSGMLDISIAFAQLETGDIATNYIPTTAAVSVGPVSNVPRLDYTNSSCPRLLLEPQRTNLFTFSEQFNNAVWLKARCTVSPNVATSPAGYLDADAVVEDTTTNSHPLYRDMTLVNATQYVASIFIKKGSRKFIRMNVTAGGVFRTYDLDTKTATNGGTIEDYGNGWLRLIYTFTSNSTSGQIYIEPLNDAGSPSYLGNGSIAYYTYGSQLEAGAYATSYIPTLAASVTRVADAASKTGISSLIGQTEGTLYAEFNVGGADGRVMSTLGGSNRFGMTASPTAVGAFIVTAAGGVVYSTSAAFTHGATTKMAFAYKSGQSVLYVNGSAVLTTTASFAFDAAITDLFLSQQEFAPGAGQSGKSQSQALLFKTRLTNSQLAELTTL